MNVNDVKEVKETDNYLKAIFEKQKELMAKYHPIEQKVLGIEQFDIKWTGESTIDNPIMQLRIKDHLWRVVEEIAESLEASEDSDIHQIEELSDALHFMVELMIFVGLDYNTMPPLEEIHKFAVDQINEQIKHISKEKSKFLRPMMIRDMYLETFYRLGLIGNCLKNKPWKQSQMRTDYKKFYDCVLNAYESLIHIFCTLDLTPKDIYEIYFKKSEVNRFRQRSKY